MIKINKKKDLKIKKISINLMLFSTCNPECSPACDPECSPGCYPDCEPNCSPECYPNCDPLCTPRCGPSCNPCYPSDHCNPNLFY